MEGPTPVSALIHAATMVTAGVYLLCRMNHVLVLTSTGRATIATIGAATAFVAATIATSQHDIKKVLAFSTVSQIGFMVLAVGSGAYAAAIFLMVAHAFFKGLLFLGAGSVIHGLDGEQELARMGGLRTLMAWTFGTFLVGWLAIAGRPAVLRVLRQGRRAEGRVGVLEAAVGDRRRRGAAHRVLHDAALRRSRSPGTPASSPPRAAGRRSRRRTSRRG